MFTIWLNQSGGQFESNVMLVYVRVELQGIGEVNPPVAQVVVVYGSTAEVSVWQFIINSRIRNVSITLENVTNSSNTKVQSFIESFGKFLDI